VERMDGSVEAGNRDRGGAIFTIRLPLTPAAQPLAS
jgi:signal transduction histidine kinase